MRKTKIVCTIGPASESREVLQGLCKAGMNVARLNFSHSSHEEHQRRINMIKSVREELELPIAILLDTKGPEYRIKTFENKKITLRDGDRFIFTAREVVGNEAQVSVILAFMTSPPHLLHKSFPIKSLASSVAGALKYSFSSIIKSPRCALR